MNDAAKSSESKEGLQEIAPGVFIDPGKVRVDANRRWLLLDARGYAELGLTEAHYRTLLRLYEVGMITIFRASPRVSLLDLESWRRHVAATTEDPWYWEDRRRLKRYRATYS